MSSAPPGSPGPKPLFLCQPFVKAALVKGSFKTIVAPPKYVDVNEWVAINCEYGEANRRQSAFISERISCVVPPTLAGGKIHDRCSLT
jgi:hypothetical protein